MGLFLGFLTRRKEEGCESSSSIFSREMGLSSSFFHVRIFFEVKERKEALLRARPGGRGGKGSINL